MDQNNNWVECDKQAYEAGQKDKAASLPCKAPEGLDALRQRLYYRGYGGRPTYQQGELGYHYVMVRLMLGEDSDALKYLDKKVKESPHLALEQVVVAEGQVIHLLYQIHIGNVKWDA